MSTKHLSRIAFALFLFATSSWSQGRKPYVDDENGYSIKAPIGFSRVPIRGGENWILAKFLSDKAYRHTFTREGRRQEFVHRPTLRVITFPHDRKEIDVKKEKKKVGSSEIDVTRITISNPYKNYEDYLKRHFQGGGWHISKVEEIRVRGIKATWTEAEIRALTDLPRDLVAIVYHLIDRDLVVEIDILPEWRAKLGKRFLNSLRSIRTFEARNESKDDEKSDVDIDPLGKLSPEERSKRRAVLFAERVKKRRMKEIKRAKSDKPKGWRVLERKNFIVLTHVGDKYTRHILNQSRYVRKWLDKRFAKLGDGQVFPSLIRIFRGQEEARAYLSGSGDSFFYETGEVVCAGQGSSILGDFSRTSGGLLRQYLTEKNPALWRALPTWLRGGLGTYVQSAFPSKAKGLVFLPPRGEFREAIQMIAAGNFPTIRQLMQSEWRMVEEEKGKNLQARQRTAANLFVRFLLEKGKKGKTKGLLQKWMNMSLKVLAKKDGDFWDKIKAEREARKIPTPMTEAEEEKAFRERKAKAREWDKYYADEKEKLLEEAFNETFATWTKNDWKKIEKKFRFWIKTGGR